MTIEFHCASCQKLLRTSDDKAGATAKCPDCGSPVQVPFPDDDYNLGGVDVADDGYGFEDASYRIRGSSQSRYGGQAPPAYSTGMKPCPMCGEQIRAAAIRCRYCGEDLDEEGYAPRSRHRQRFEYAGFWLRFCAAFVDGIVLTAFNLILVLMMGIPLIQQPEQFQQPGDAGKRALVNLIGILVGWLYAAFLESSEKQATLGKMAMGIVVTDEFGDRVSFGKATGRHFGKILSAIILLIGYIMAAFTEKKQALHDIMAGCLVIRK